MDSAKELLDDLSGPGRSLRKLIPGVYAGFADIGTATMIDGALSLTVKELMALAISVTRECDGCVAAHARGAWQAGATEVEVAEALGVAIFLNGGPGTVWAARAFAAFQEFSASEA